MVADRIINSLRNLNLKKNQKVGINAKKSDGNEYIKLSEKDIIDINLKGVGIGNGWMSPIDQGKYASFLYYHGMLDGEQYLTLLQLEEELIGMVGSLG